MGRKPSNAVKKNKESIENFLALPFFWFCVNHLIYLPKETSSTLGL